MAETLERPASAGTACNADPFAKLPHNPEIDSDWFANLSPDPKEEETAARCMDLYLRYLDRLRTTNIPPDKTIMEMLEEWWRNDPEAQQEVAPSHEAHGSERQWRKIAAMALRSIKPRHKGKHRGSLEPDPETHKNLDRMRTLFWGSVAIGNILLGATVCLWPNNTPEIRIAPAAPSLFAAEAELAGVALTPEAGLLSFTEPDLPE